MATVKANKDKTGKVISYRFRCCIGRDAQGKQIFSTKTVPAVGLTPAKEMKKMQADADAWEQSVKKGYAPQKQKSFSAFIEDDFLPVHVRNGEHSPTTVKFYEDICKTLIERFGKCRLDSIRSLDIEKFLTELSTEKHVDKKGNEFVYKPSYVAHFRTVLTVAFGFAERHAMLEKNPMRFVKSVKRERLEIDFLDESEVNNFIRCLSEKAPLYWRVALTIVVMLTLRRGELSGLQWGDIDFATSTLSVSRNVVGNRGKDGSRLIVKATKTESSKRVLPVQAPLLSLLKKWQLEQVDTFSCIMPANAFVFPSMPDLFTPIRPDSITQWLDRFCRKYGEEYGFHKVSPHDLRHTAASLLLAAGCSPKEVQMICGHSDASTTLRFYTGVSQQQLKKATDRIANVLSADI